MTEPSLRSDVGPNPPQAPNDLWRNEVHARVAGYRKRRGRRLEGAFSMRFAFPPEEPPAAPAIALEDQREGPQAAPREAPHDFNDASLTDVVTVDVMAEATAPTVLTVAPTETGTNSGVEPPPTLFQPDLVASPDPLSGPAPVHPVGDKRKVIAFPRPPAPPQAFYRLADPVVPEQPRILDVAEELQPYSTTPLLDGLQLPSAPQIAAAPPADHIELPFQAAKISRRFYAGLVDCGLVLAAAAAFGAAAYRMVPKLSAGKPVLLAAGIMLALLWAAYQYLFTMYSGATPGMRALRLHLSTFQGGPLSWRQRRNRVLGLYFSAASLLMGLFWALVDVDALCWHDRISRTYVARRE
ncbi:MAG TPA: RDD family protein [Terriglobales bacterium]|nr:RDD family protein [Terriglobales bacterium]